MIIVDCADADKEFYGKIANGAFCRLMLKGDAYVELIFAGKVKMRKINCETRGIDRVTDVLSFPLLDKIAPFTKQNYPLDFDALKGAVNLGSIVVCSPAAKSQALKYGHTLEREKGFLFLHGLLHLLGFDHENENDMKKMRDAEENILSGAGIIR